MFDATGDGLPKKVQSASTNLYWEEGFREPDFVFKISKSSQSGEQPLFKSSIELSCWIWNWKYTKQSISDRNLVR